MGWNWLAFANFEGLRAKLWVVEADRHLVTWTRLGGETRGSEAESGDLAEWLTKGKKERFTIRMLIDGFGE
jgi:hypothetical protein